MPRIQVRCIVCNRTMEIDRRPSDPKSAMELLVPCPACDDGDFHEPRYLTASGRDANLCDCERGHNGFGMAGRECDCQAPRRHGRAHSPSAGASIPCGR